MFVERQRGKRLGLKNAFIWSWSDLKVSPQRAEVVVGEISEGSPAGHQLLRDDRGGQPDCQPRTGGKQPCGCHRRHAGFSLMIPIFGMTIGIIRGDAHLLGKLSAPR